MAFRHLTGCMLLVVLPAVYAAPEPPPRAALRGSRASSPTEESLQRAASLELPAGTSLGEALDKIRELSGTNLVVNWPALTQFGITREQEVSLPPLKDVPLAKILQLVLDQVSATLGGVTRLDWIIEDNVVYMSTREDIQEHLNDVPAQRQARTAEVQINLVDKMKDTYFDPAAAGVVAIGAIKAELQRSGKNVTNELENLLEKTRSQGLRNALHMTLRDLYQQQGNESQVMDHLTRMLTENDAACASGARPAAPASQPALR